MNTASKILWLKNIDKEDIAECGRLAVHLAELIKLKIKVPNGFVINNSGFEEFIKQNQLTEIIKELLKKIQSNMLATSQKFLQDNTKEVGNYEEFKKVMDINLKIFFDSLTPKTNCFRG